MENAALQNSTKTIRNQITNEENALESVKMNPHRISGPSESIWCGSFLGALLDESKHCGGKELRRTPRKQHEFGPGNMEKNSKALTFEILRKFFTEPKFFKTSLEGVLTSRELG